MLNTYIKSLFWDLIYSKTLMIISKVYLTLIFIKYKLFTQFFNKLFNDMIEKKNWILLTINFLLKVSHILRFIEQKKIAQSFFGSRIGHSNIHLKKEKLEAGLLLQLLSNMLFFSFVTFVFLLNWVFNLFLDC